MAVYDFKCPECNHIKEDVVMSIKHEDHEHPECCGVQMDHYITIPPMVRFRDAEFKDGGFIAHSIAGKPVITSRRQNREMMKRHNLIDANDLGPPPTKADQMKEHAKTQQTIADITPTKQVLSEMKRQGLTDIV